MSAYVKITCFIFEFDRCITLSRKFDEHSKASGLVELDHLCAVLTVGRIV